MSYNWKEYFELSSRLGSQGTTEADFRSAISRAYYAIFNLAKVRGEQIKNGKFPRTRTHQAVSEFYISRPSDEEKLLGKYLQEYKKKRNEADYDSDKSVSKEIAQEFVSEVEEQIEVFESRILKKS